MSSDVNTYVAKTQEMSNSRLILPVASQPPKNMISQVYACDNTLKYRVA